MLFDLRGRGRRRTVQVIYLFLALLMGGGLVFFGIGGGAGSGGLLDAVGQGGGSANGLAIYKANISAAVRQTTLAPKDPAGWDTLAQARYQLADAQYSVPATGAFLSKGQPLLIQAAEAWASYLALRPKHPDANLASDMVRALVDINLIPGAIAAQQIVASANPTSAAQFARLAVLNYLAGDVRAGDRAGAHAVHLATGSERPLLRSELATQKRQAAAALASVRAKQLSGPTGSTGATGAAGVRRPGG